MLLRNPHVETGEDVVIAATAPDVVKVIDELRFPQRLRLPLLLAWADLQDLREREVLAQTGVEVSHEARASYIHGMGLTCYARLQALSFVNLNPLIEGVWVYEGTLPYAVTPNSAPAMGNVFDRAKLLERLIELETNIALKMTPKPVKYVGLHISLPMD